MSERLERVQDRDHEERTGEAGGGGGCLRQDAGVFFSSVCSQHVRVFMSISTVCNSLLVLTIGSRCCGHFAVRFLCRPPRQ
jgi:hypothetical protein